MRNRTILRDSVVEEATMGTSRDGRSKMRDARFGSGRSWHLHCIGLCLVGVVALQSTALSSAYNINAPSKPGYDPEYDGVCADDPDKEPPEQGDGDKEQCEKCSEYDSATDCDERVCGYCSWEADDAPDSLPSLGERVYVRQRIVGDIPALRWGRHIGFGRGRALTCLAKVQLTKDFRFARVFDPSGKGTASFERDGDALVYALVENDRGMGADAIVEFSDVVEDVPQTAVLTFPNGRVWTFALEPDADETSSDCLPSFIYRVVQKMSRDGYATTVAYNTSNVTVTDASGHDYVCSFDANGRITSVSVNGATWSYAYAGSTVTETNTRTAESIAMTTNADLRVSAIVRNGGHLAGGADDYRYYDVNGHLSRRVVNGVETTFSISASETSATRAVTTGGITRTAFYGFNGLMKKRNGLGQEKRFTRNSMRQATSVTNERGKTWIYTRDANGYVTYERDPDGVETTYNYDPANYNLNSKVTSDGTWSYGYDDLNRLTMEVFPDGGERRYVRYSADEHYAWRGLVKYEITRRDATTWTAVYYEYNSMGQVTLGQSPWYCDPDDPAEDQPSEGDEDYAKVAYAYDSWGNRTCVTDENGIVTGYGYDLANRLTSVTSPDSGMTTYLYDGLGRKIKQQDAVGAFTEWHYDSRGFIDEISGSAANGGGCSSCGQAAGAGGKLGLYVYNDAGLLLSFEDLNHHVWTYGYDAAGRKIWEKDPLNNQTGYAYYADDSIHAVTDANSNATTYTYTDAGRIESVENGAGDEVTYGYDDAGRQDSVTDGEGGTRTTTYDSMGRVDAVTVTATPSPNQAVSYSYDLEGNLVGMTANGIVTAYEHDVDGNQTVVITDFGGTNATVTENHYDAGGRLTKTVVDPDGLAITTTYHYYAGTNRLHKVKAYPDGFEDPAIVTASYIYDALGRQTEVSRGGLTTYTTYNNAGWVTQVNDNETITNYCYDEVGNRVCVTVSGRAPVYYEYDDANRLVGTEQTDETTYGTPVTIATSRVPDGVGNVLTSTDGENKTTTYTYDGANRVETVTNPESETTTYTYDGAGRRTDVEFANGSARHYDYDAAGQLVQTSGGPEGTLAYTYDAFGRQTTVTDANGRTRDTDYDDLGRVVEVRNEMDQPVKYRYDAAGRRYELEDANGNVTSYEYDGANRLVSMTYPEVAGDPANVESYTYYDSGLLMTKTTPNGAAISYGYNGAGQLASVGFGDRAVLYGRDGAGAVTSIGGEDDITTIGYAYDLLGRMTSSSDSALGKTISYDNDLRGLRTGLALDGTAVAYGYDDAGRLESVTKDLDGPAGYIYDEGGRRDLLTLPNGVSTVYGYTTSDQLLSLTTTGPGGTLASFTYELDDTGNRDSITYADGSKSVYSYDDAYRLTNETRLASDGSEEYVVSYEYDDVGNRLRMITTLASAYVPDEDTMALWHLDEPEGSFEVADASGNGHTGTVGSVTLGEAGRFDTAALFSGLSGSVIEVEDSNKLEFHDNEFTVEAWIRPATVEGALTVVAHWGDEPPTGPSNANANANTNTNTNGNGNANAHANANANAGSHGKAKKAKPEANLGNKPDDTPAAKPENKPDKNDKGHQHSWRLIISDGALSFEWRVGNHGGVVAGGEVEVDKWTHVAVARRADTDGDGLDEIVVLVGGTVVATAQMEGGLRNARSPFTIGATDVADAPDYFEGKIDEVRFSRGDVTAEFGPKQTNYRYNARNQLTVEYKGPELIAPALPADKSVKTYAYDKNGSVTDIVETVGAVEISSEHMEYDELNRMLSHTGPNGTENFSYRGAEWHRVSANGTSFLYDGDNVLADVAGGALAALYVTPFLDQNLSLTKGGSTYYYSQDGLGSVRTLTDATGAVVNSYDYLAFGGAYSPTTTVSLPQRYTYTGRELNPASDLMYYRYRTYDPRIGRFGARDPIMDVRRRFSGEDAPLSPDAQAHLATIAKELESTRRGLALDEERDLSRQLEAYGYTGARPVVAVDPSGLLTCCACAFTIFGGPPTFTPSFAGQKGYSVSVGTCVALTGWAVNAWYCGGKICRLRREWIAGRTLTYSPLAMQNVVNLFWVAAPTKVWWDPECP